ncbi:PVC-type heme-binding CxxCH protein [Tundrisphaera sp. TA3]|uniref:PVC-type heme-binding CxxCH protein n=1 Tax=Tundrisphaera sp. TA3 TaxID=3435775 RepID=UPI003EBD1745
MMRRWMARARRWSAGPAWALLLAAAAPSPASAQDESYKPEVAQASEEAGRAISSIRVADGMKIELFAAEPMLANPVAFCIDEKGRFYVAETFRHHAGVTDNRNHMAWLDTDFANRTVADRVAMYRKFLSPEDFAAYQTEHERVRLIEDRDGDGKADFAEVFADGFKDAAAGIGAGLLARKGDVYYTCIPDLWLLKDTNGDGKADVRESLHTGYGVHVAFLGHDLHGLKFGPDGRLYFSIGDRGAEITARDGRRVSMPDTGAVFRCEPDGSRLEVFAFGLRNPQELAFDDMGNLFTGDNNSDGGDKARWVHVVQGGDSGWRIGYQNLTYPVPRGPWNAEKLWYPRWDGQASYIIPPIANLGDGPSGLARDPGTGLPAKYRNHFFLADFRGSKANSGIRSFANKPNGASFDLVDSEQFIWSVLATDVDFGPDGSVYLTDWINGWNKPNKGRIWKISAKDADPAAAEVKALMAEGMTARPPADVIKLLGHADQRIRQEAQFELADRMKAGDDALYRSVLEAAKSAPSLVGRVHAIWALGQDARREAISPPAKPRPLFPLFSLMLDDTNPEIRAQVARTLLDAGRAPEGEHDIKRIAEALAKDEDPRVKFFFARLLGTTGNAAAVAPLLGLLRDNADKDAYLRHAAVMGLVDLKAAPALAAAAADPSASVRMGVLLAMRRLGLAEIARFLADADPKVATESALAIYDAPIAGAMETLAATPARKEAGEPMLRRILNAAYRLGRPADAATLAGLANRDDMPKAIRLESLSDLAAWTTPPGRDRVTGLWRPIADRTAEAAADALRPSIAGLLRNAPEEIRREAIRAAGSLKLREAGPELFAIVTGGQANGPTRADALKSLEAIDDPRLAEAVGVAAADKEGAVRSEGLRILARLSPEKAVPALGRVIEAGSAAEKQKAFAVLGGIDHPDSDAILARSVEALAKSPDSLAAARLELLAAAARKASPEVKRQLEAFEAARPKDGPLADHLGELQGGDAERGEKIFRENAAVYCVRCHKVKGEGGEVGPELTAIGAKHPREYLLESIVVPNKAIAQGFESVVVAKSDGLVISGVYKGEDDKTLRLISVEGKPIEISKADIEERKSGASAMPDDLAKKLTPAELRDLVEFLATRK